jgi:phenylacetate-CoA ligase
MKQIIRKSVIQKSTKDLKELQLKLLKKQVHRIYEKSNFYRRKFKKASLKPSDIRNLDDVMKIPLTTREELEQNFSNVLAVPNHDVATIRLSSGTTGHPLRIALTRKDVASIAEASARRLAYHGVTNRDVVQITSAYGLWQGAWSMHWGAERIGACVIPVGPADTERQILLVKQFGTTILYGATNYHFRILEVAKALGEDLTKYCLRMAVCVAEKPTKAQIATLKKECGYEKVVIDYGATEFPGFSVNCAKNQDVHHVWGDFHLIEVVDPETREPLGEGEKGELTITSLQREAFPLLRYLSRDVTKYIGFGKCECGMFHPRISADIDRVDFMTKIRGVTVFPSHIEFLLSKFPQLTGRCQIIVDKRTPRHDSVLRVETGSILSEAAERSLKEEVVTEIKSRVGITFNEVTFISPNQLEGKFKKVVIVT